jgi:hypothetical protein
VLRASIGAGNVAGIPTVKGGTVSNFEFFASVAIGWFIHMFYLGVKRMGREIQAMPPAWKDPTDTPYN